MKPQHFAAIAMIVTAGVLAYVDAENFMGFIIIFPLLSPLVAMEPGSSLAARGAKGWGSSA